MSPSTLLLLMQLYLIKWFIWEFWNLDHCFKTKSCIRYLGCGGCYQGQTRCDVADIHKLATFICKEGADSHFICSQERVAESTESYVSLPCSQYLKLIFLCSCSDISESRIGREPEIGQKRVWSNMRKEGLVSLSLALLGLHPI